MLKTSGNGHEVGQCKRRVWDGNRIRNGRRYCRNRAVTNGFCKKHWLVEDAVAKYIKQVT